MWLKPSLAVETHDRASLQAVPPINSYLRLRERIFRQSWKYRRTFRFFRPIMKRRFKRLSKTIMIRWDISSRYWNRPVTWKEPSGQNLFNATLNASFGLNQQNSSIEGAYRNPMDQRFRNFVIS